MVAPLAPQGRVAHAERAGEADRKAWREQARHRIAQRLGRERWYQYYRIDVAQVVRTNAFDRA